jgi:hypothetical protein
MDINSVLLICSLCVMTVVTGYSGNVWYKYFNRKLDL